MVQRLQRQSLLDTWNKRIKEWYPSGLSIRAWCRQQALSYQQFLYWQTRIAKRDEQTENSGLVHSLSRIFGHKRGVVSRKRSWEKRGFIREGCDRRSEHGQNSLDAPLGFVSLPDETPKLSSDSGIVIQCQGIQIHISSDFDSKTLLRCLKTVRSQEC